MISLAVSCKRDESLDIRNTEYISFKLSDGGIIASGEVTKGSCDTLSYEITDWDYTGDESDTDIQTKGTLTESLSGEVGIFAQWSESSTLAMNNARHTVSGSELVSDSTVLWKNYTSGTLSFFAYAPYDTALVPNYKSSKPYFTYTVPTDISKQKDMLYATAVKTCSTSDRTAIPLAFRHGLTAVQFKMGFGCTLKEIRLRGIASTGDFYLNGDSPDVRDTTTYTLTFGSGSGSSVAKDTIFKGSDYTLIMLPQTFSSDKSKIELVYNDGNDKTISASLDGTSWPAGKKVTYTLGKSGSETKYIYFDLCAGNVILTDTTYSGFIYVNGIKSTVHGEHADTNNYYVFQSVTNSSVTAKTGGDKVYYLNCGYKDSTDYNNRTHCRIPDYGDLSVTLAAGTMSWDEAVINHPEPAKLCDEWRDTTKTKNYSTINRILICGHKTNATVFDVTIDHIWSRYFPYKKGATIDNGAPRSADMSDRYGGITIGESELDVRPKSGTKVKFKNYSTERVTLRLKNHSVLHRLNYCKAIKSSKPGFLKITSADGDGISKGSLSLFFPPANKDTNFTNFRCGLLGTGNYGSTREEEDMGYPQRQLKDFELNGGILNIQMRPFSDSQWKNNGYLMACFGSVNSQCDITINGGTITAVSNSTAAAIGGGGGWRDNGGGGNVTINGGNVYAYNFGVRIRKGDAIPSTAIGGGSTNGQDSTSNFGAVGNVDIRGGNVYAYSAGGTAIGAGSSARHKGGDATVNIYGGNVTAISAPGTIGGKAVTQSTAIGGGRAGYVDGNGGDATVTISGGTLQSGSVGGGKCDNTHADYGKIGSASITISGGNTSAQFIMARGATTDPTFLMTAGTIRNSSTSDNTYKKVQNNGGAVYMESGTCTIEGGTVSNCSASLGGAVYMNGGTFNMSGGTIKNCKASTDGGGVYIEGGDVNLSGTGTIHKNIASKGDGGGVCIRGGNFDMTGGNVTNNSADSNPENFQEGNGGGIYVSSKTDTVTVSITGGIVQYNASDRNGGGLCVDMSDANPGITANIVIGTVGGEASTPNISANSAALSGGGMAVEGQGSRITINSGTVKGNVSAYVKNEDIRNDGGIVDLVGKGSEVNVNYKTIRFYANNGSDPEPSDDQRVITSTNSVFKPTATALAFKKDFYHLDHWNTKRDDSGTPYPLDGGGATMNITEDVALYGQWVRN